MKKIFTLVCAVLGMSATMYGANADLSEYLGEGEENSSFTITTNEDGTLTFSGAYSGTEDEEDAYSVSFTMAVDKNDDDDEGTYTLTMSNFSITGKLSDAFKSLTAKITGITKVDVSVGDYTISKTGKGEGSKDWDLSTYIGYLDGASKLASLITVEITCTSEAEIAMTVGENTITCGFTVDEEKGISFTADGLENIFDELTVDGDIEEITSGDKDITEEALTVYKFSSSVTFNDGYSYWKEVSLTQDQLFGSVDPASATEITFSSTASKFNIGFNTTLTADPDAIDETALKTVTGADEGGYWYSVDCESGSPVTIPVEYIKMDENYLFKLALGLADGVDYTISWITYGTEENPDYNPEDSKYTWTAISSIKSDVEAVEVARYNLAGQKISGEQKGINIIVYSDGTSKKVLVK